MEMHRQPPPQRVAAITLDLDDTLWPSAPAIAAAEQKLHAWLAEYAPAMAAAMPPPAFALFRRALAAERPEMAHDFTALRHVALMQALALYGEDPALADGAMEVFLSARSTVELFPDAAAALERLAARYRLVAVTNGNADLERAGLARFFTCVVNARMAGCAKPDRRIFHAACASVAAAHGEVLHAGDHPDYDVRGAARAGLRPVWINRSQLPWPGEPEDYVEFRDLAAFCDWLGA